tara:strand:+ start:4528 stop:5340 length:813 start_codon:yes stop_codon:yes gene_type:complete
MSTLLTIAIFCFVVYYLYLENEKNNTSRFSRNKLMLLIDGNVLVEEYDGQKHLVFSRDTPVITFNVDKEGNGSKMNESFEEFEKNISDKYFANIHSKETTVKSISLNKSKSEGAFLSIAISNKTNLKNNQILTTPVINCQKNVRVEKRNEKETEIKQVESLDLLPAPSSRQVLPPVKTVTFSDEVIEISTPSQQLLENNNSTDTRVVRRTRLLLNGTKEEVEVVEKVEVAEKQLDKKECALFPAFISNDTSGKVSPFSKKNDDDLEYSLL